MSDTIVVTGGAGFIGSHVVDRLLSAGCTVEVIDDLSTGRKENLAAGAKLHRLDIRSPELPRLMAELKPASVVHLAAQIDVRRSLREPAYDADINLVGGLNVVRSALDAGAVHFVFASSAATYGPPESLPLREDAPARPVSPYGVSKMAFEHYLRVFHQVNGLPVAILRFANVYGPRQSAKGEAGAVAIFLKQLLNGQPPTINGDGNQTRDYVYVGDVANMVATAVGQRLKGTFNVSTGRETSVNELAEKLIAITGKNIRPEHRPAVPNEDRRNSLSPEKARFTVGWQATVALSDGLEMTYDFARNDPGFR